MRLCTGVDQVGKGPGVEDLVEPGVELGNRGRSDARTGLGRKGAEAAGRQAGQVLGPALGLDRLIAAGLFDRSQQVKHAPYLSGSQGLETLNEPEQHHL
jgi:hypothetical protein